MPKYEVPALSYAFDALEPHIDAQTMQIHHDRHHAAYVANANAALESHPDLLAKPVDALLANLSQVPEAIRTTVRNNAGGHANHSLFWTVIGPGGGGEPKGKLADDLRAHFGSFSNFQQEFAKAAMGRFGSGWAWLVADRGGKLAVTSTQNQDNPVMEGLHPLLGLDVWEHAYYLKYQNRRADYVAAFWNVVDWEAVTARHGQAKG